VDDWRADSLVHSVVIVACANSGTKGGGLFPRDLVLPLAGTRTIGALGHGLRFSDACRPTGHAGLARHVRPLCRVLPPARTTQSVPVAYIDGMHFTDLAAVTLIVLYRRGFSEFIFGSSGQTNLVLLLAAGLVASGGI